MNAYVPQGHHRHGLRAAARSEVRRPPAATAQPFIHVLPRRQVDTAASTEATSC